MDFSNGKTIISTYFICYLNFKNCLHKKDLKPSCVVNFNSFSKVLESLLLVTCQTFAFLENITRNLDSLLILKFYLITYPFIFCKLEIFCCNWVCFKKNSLCLNWLTIPVSNGPLNKLIYSVSPLIIKLENL